MLIHCVYFWLKPGISATDEAAYVKGANSLLEIPSVKYGWVGKPAATDRPIIDRSYSYALVVVFENDAGHDEYQVHPIHDIFRDTYESYWNQVKIYDSMG